VVGLGRLYHSGLGRGQISISSLLCRFAVSTHASLNFGSTFHTTIDSNPIEGNLSC